jgi:hypothetical protein
MNNRPSASIPGTRTDASFHDAFHVGKLSKDPEQHECSERQREITKRPSARVLVCRCSQADQAWGREAHFAWTIQSEQAGMVTNAITYVGRTVVDSFRRNESEIPRMERTVAHESGHFISNSDGPSHDDKSSDLMYGDSTQTPGTILRRKRIQRFGRD